MMVGYQYKHILYDGDKVKTLAYLTKSEAKISPCLNIG